jgi:hypothetical protein
MNISQIGQLLWKDNKLQLPIAPIPFTIGDRETKIMLYTTAGVIAAGLITSAIINNANKKRT